MQRDAVDEDVDATSSRERARGSSPWRRGPGLSDTHVAGGSGVTVATGGREHDVGSVFPGSSGAYDDGSGSDVKEGEDDDVEEGRATDPDGAEEADERSSNEDPTLVPVDPPLKYHASWDAWQEYFIEYCQRTMQVLPVKETMSGAERNKRLKKTKKGEDDSQLIPEAIDPYQRTYICTHGWKKRKTRSEGSRPKQHIRLTDCLFRFVVQWNSARGELQVKNGCFSHNHQISTAAYATYPVSRGITDPLVGARVEGMLSVGAKRSRIYDYLLEHDQNVIQVDVDNLVRDHSSAVSRSDDNDATAREIALFSALDPENLSSVAETESGETGVISLTSAHMRRMFGRFSEVLLIDCSHKTNRYNYQLLTFMGMNEFGEGAVVQQSLIEANGDWHMERAIDHFKRSHPTRIDLLRVIMVDKDLNEIRVLETNFPGARILVCHFHVIKYMKEMRAKPEFGKISSEDASQIDGAVHKMIYAACEELYKASRDALQGICARIGLNGFYEYFLKNWDSCQDRWVYYLRSKLPHFRNHTNNRLESFFGKLKDAVDGSMSMAACVKALVANDRRVENEYKYRLSRIGRFTNSGYDEEMSTVLRFTTHYMAGQIEQQYATALSKADSYNYVEDQENSGVVVVNGVFSEHKLSLADWRCDCEFSMSMKLPCRHAIAYRKHCNASGPLIPWSGIDERWTTTAQALKKVKQFSYEKFDDEGEGGPKKKLRTQSERYREAVRATHLIANEMAEIEDEDEFKSMLKFVLDQWRNVRQRKRVAVRQQVGVASSCVDEDEHCEAKFTDAQVKTEFDISSSEQEVPSASSEEESSMDTESSVSRDKSQKKQVTIRLNPKAKKVGRPQKKKKATSAGEKKDRKWYEAIEEGRETAGEVTLSALLNSLDREQPGLVETQRRLSGVLVKFEEAEKKKPKYKVLKNPVLILDPFFVLPSKLLSACIKVLPVSNTQDTAISIDDSQSSKGPRQQRASGKEGVETVLIKDVGSFSRDQIEIFKRVQNMKAAVHSGIDMHRWLVDKGIASLPAGYHGFANQVADEVMATYPYKKIQGLPNLTDYTYVMLYTVSPPEWLTDAAIRAVCWRLTEDYPTCRFAGFQSASPKQKRTRNKENDLVDVSIRTAVQQYIRDDSVQTVMLPLNFDNFHWCCVVIKVTEKRIYSYDPLNQTAYVNACSEIATTLKITGLQDYNVISQNNPLQFDGFSCGVYVCWMFIHKVIPGLHVDMIDTSLTRRRVELFFYLLKGRLLPLEGNTAVASNPDDEEEKMKAPSSEEKPGSDEEVPSTQIAQ